MNLEPISVIEISNRIGVHKTAVFKALKKLGISAKRAVNQNSRGQSVATLSHAEAVSVEAYFRGERASSRILDSNESGQTGEFYLVQLEPEYDPGRFKLGFAISVQERLRSLRCSAPLLTLVRSWPCKPLWEKTAIDCVTAIGCERLHTEVFRTSDLKSIEGRCEAFFDLLKPAISAETDFPDTDLADETS